MLEIDTLGPNRTSLYAFVTCSTGIRRIVVRWHVGLVAPNPYDDASKRDDSPA